MRFGWISRRSYLTRRPFITVVVVGTLFCVLFFWLQVRLYDGLRMGLRDLGFFQQALDSTLHGSPFTIRQGYTSNTAVSHLFHLGWDQRSLFSEHVYLITPIFLPLYALTRSAYSLFAVNVAVIAAAALPLYLLARRRLHAEWLAAVVASAFLLHPSTQIATLGDYIYGPHPDNFAPFAIFATLYFAETRRPRAFWLMGLLGLAAADNVAPAVAAVGLFAAWAHADWRRHGLALAAAGVAAFIVESVVIIPAAGGGQQPYYFAAFKTLFAALDHPEFLAQIAQSVVTLFGAVLLPLALLPIAGGAVWLIALPELLSGLAAQTIGYTIPLEPGSWHVWSYVIAACLGLIRAFELAYNRSQRLAGLAAVVVIGALGIGAVQFGPYPFSRDVWSPVYDVDAARAAVMARAEAIVPYTATLSTEFFAGSHFAGRPNVTWFPVNWQSSDFVLAHPAAWAWWSEDDGRVLELLKRSGNVEPVIQEQGIDLFKRRAAPPMNPLPAAHFGNGIRLVGYQVDAKDSKPGGAVEITWFWTTDRGLTVPLTVFNHLIKADGSAVAQRDSQPDNGAYPTTAWAPGEMIVDRQRIRLPDTVAPGSYAVRVGLYDLVTGQRVVTEAGETEVQPMEVTVEPR